MKDRELAICILEEIFEWEGYNNVALRRAFKKNNEFTPVQKAFVTEIVNGTLRNLLLLDYIVDKFSKIKTNKMKPFVLNVFRISVYQILFMDKVPVSAACNEAVEMVKKRGFKGLSGFVNAVLRNVARNIDNIQYPDCDKNFIEYVSIKYSYPKWIIEYWLKFLKQDEILKMCIKNSQPPNVTLVVNVLKADTDGLFQILKDDGIAVEKIDDFENVLRISRTDDISKIKAYKNGLFHIMDKSSVAAVKELAPKENDFIIDVCAAPGGKSFLCGYFMNNLGRIKSRDIYKHKIELIAGGAERLGIDIIETEIKDALTVYDEDFKTADKVIVDAPCSGLGIVRKKPDIKYSKSYDDVKNLADIQRNILSVCQNYVKDGGVLLYTTCTISYEENEKNVKWFAENFDFKLVSQRQILPQNFDSDGFFIAKFVRNTKGDKFND